MHRIEKSKSMWKEVFKILKCSSIAACLYKKANYDGIISDMLLPGRLCIGMYIRSN